jgi:hypothetical protein
MHPGCDDCVHCNTKWFDTGKMQMCVLAARDVKLERDAIVEHHRRLIKGALKCGPTGVNFVARVAG